MSWIRRLGRNMRQHYDLYLMLLPGAIIIAIFNYIPMYGIQLAFRKFQAGAGVAGGEWVGLEYITKFFNSYQFWDLIMNTVRLSLATLVFSFPIPIILALLFNHIRSPRRKKVMQTVVYLPHFISTVVIVGMLKIFFMNNEGLMSQIVRWITGYQGSVYGAADTFVPMYVISDIWQHAGWNSIIYLAALSTIDVSLYDACKIDGANGWQIIRYVDFPALIPTMIILLILNVGTILGVGFEKAFLMQTPPNLNVSEILSTYIYKIGIQHNQYSYSAAISLFNTVVNFFFVFVMNTVVRRVGKISLW